MFALFWKDMQILRKSLRFYTLFSLFYLLLALLGLYEFTFILSCSTFMMMMLPLSAFTVESGPSPHHHLDLVKARYLFALFIALLMFSLNMTIGTIYSIATRDYAILMSLFVVSTGSLALSGILLLLAFCLPIQKMRPILYGIVFLAMTGISQLPYLSLSPDSVFLYGLVLPFSVFLLSYFLSCSLVSKGLQCYNREKKR